MMALLSCNDEFENANKKGNLSSSDVSTRIVAIGDLHGDYERAKEALILANVMDEDLNWIGDTTTVVQTGDILDRGDGERAIIDLFESLQVQAEEVGGRVITLNGNHEIMNAVADYRYVEPKPDICLPYADLEGLETDRPEFYEFADHECRIRAAAFYPGGPYALMLADNPMVLILGENVFVHGGLHQRHVDYGIDKINSETSAFLRGDGELPDIMLEPRKERVHWSRIYNDDDPPSATACQELDRVLDELGAQRMIVGHGRQTSINSACDNAVWRIDTGMASHYGSGSLEVLEITGDEVNVLMEPTSNVNCDGNCSSSCPCGVGQGDCDHDSDCEGNLVCPDDGPGSEYCQEPTTDSCHTVAPNHSDYCSSSCPCRVGEGDCDRDSHCQIGLTCRHDIGAEYGLRAELDICTS
jgi:hypothetical protein